MIKSLITESAKKLNFFPAKNGISLYYSSRMIQHYQNLGYCAWHHCQFALNAYVHAPEKPVFPNHTNAPCSLDCIYLRYNDNAQGVHELQHLPTNSLITRCTVTPLPPTPLAIINQVHTLAEQEKLPDGLKISNRSGQLFMIVVGMQEWIMTMKHLKMHKVKTTINNKLVMTIVMTNCSKETMMKWLRMKYMKQNSSN